MAMYVLEEVNWLKPPMEKTETAVSGELYCQLSNIFFDASNVNAKLTGAYFISGYGGECSI